MRRSLTARRTYATRGRDNAIVLTDHRNPSRLNAMRRASPRGRVRSVAGAQRMPRPRSPAALRAAPPTRPGRTDPRGGVSRAAQPRVTRRRRRDRQSGRRGARCSPPSCRCQWGDPATEVGDDGACCSCARSRSARCSLRLARAARSQPARLLHSMLCGARGSRGARRCPASSVATVDWRAPSAAPNPVADGPRSRATWPRPRVDAVETV